MIIVPRPEEPMPATGEAASILTGGIAPLPLGTIRLPADPPPAAPEDDPVALADALRERAGDIFRRHRTIGAFNRDLDAAFARVAEGDEWWHGLESFDRDIDSLRRKHAAGLRTEEDRTAFERHAGEFVAMQRIALKRALAERQQADAAAVLEESLAYYADKAAAAPNEVFRQIAIDAGLRAIDEQHDAGYLFPSSVDRQRAAFLGSVETNDVERILAADPAAALRALDNGQFPRLVPGTRAALRARALAQAGGGEPDAIPANGPRVDGAAEERARYERSIRSDPVLGISVGAGEMPPEDPRHGSQVLPPRTAPDPHRSHAPDKPGWHSYTQGPTELCRVADGCTAEMVKDALLRFAVPGRDPKTPVRDGEDSPVHIPGTERMTWPSGHVRTTIGPDGMSITNVTHEGHVLHDGEATRSVELRDGIWYVTTTGKGNNERPFMGFINQHAGPRLFALVDSEMRKYIQAQLKR